MNNQEFQALIRDITKTDAYRGMKHYRHHIKGNAYDHSIKVARLCYRHHKRFGKKTDLGAFVRGALLHDYYLYDWHDKSPDHRFHGFTHPRRALRNALDAYPDLSPTEQDMILRHMFPLTPIPPRTREGWLLCFYDKIAAISDYCSKSPRKKRRTRKH